MIKNKIILGILSVSMAVWFQGCASGEVQLTKNTSWCDSNKICTNKASIVSFFATNYNPLASSLAASTTVNGKRLKTTDTVVDIIRIDEDKQFSKYNLQKDVVYLAVYVFNMEGHHIGDVIKIYDENTTLETDCFAEDKIYHSDHLERVCSLDKPIIDLLLTGHAKLKIDIGEDTPVVLPVTNPISLSHLKFLSVDAINYVGFKEPEISTSDPLEESTKSSTPKQQEKPKPKTEDEKLEDWLNSELNSGNL